MGKEINRREFIQLTAGGCALCLAGIGCQQQAVAPAPMTTKLISPGCRRSKVKVARIYMGTPASDYWPKPNIDLKKEVRFYESEFAKLDELSDVEFVVNKLVGSPAQVAQFKDELQDVDGILIIHMTMRTGGVVQELLKAQKPTMIFAVPYSGHGWTGFGALRNEPEGAMMDCMLTKDYNQLAAAIRPFRAIHHLREARILNVTTRSFDSYANSVRDKFGTEIKQIGLPRVADAYKAVDNNKAEAETRRWINGAEMVVEPSREEIFKSCKLALAFEKMLEEEDATVMTVDCYGTMWDKTIKLPAFPCLGFSRLNCMGLGGICESDLRSAMTHIIFQGLAGKPSFISDPTVDESTNTIILAHCMGTPKMDGPNGPMAPYKLRTVMERRQGVVPQVEMRIGETVTQAELIGTDLMLYFMGEITDTLVGLEHDRGCRTKFAVKVDGDVEKLWKNWSHGLHRQTCYGDITRELQHFCRFKEIDLVDEVTGKSILT